VVVFAAIIWCKDYRGGRNAVTHTCRSNTLHLLEADLVTPFVLGRRYALNPVVIFGSLMFFAWLWGVIGALVAVPLLVVLLRQACGGRKNLPASPPHGIWSPVGPIAISRRLPQPVSRGDSACS
jgi:hypothetical protein